MRQWEFSLVAQAISRCLSIARCVLCVVLCCVALRCDALLLLAGAGRVVCLGAQMTKQEVQPVTTACLPPRLRPCLCALECDAEDTSTVSTCL